MLNNLPSEIAEMTSRLRHEGYKALVIGGVRDTLLGITPSDWDISTSALPERIKEIFSDCAPDCRGEKYGTVSVTLDGVTADITTFRKDGEYRDGRHPENVEFTDNVFADLRRRDFTVNAIAYDPQSDIFTDCFCGRRDLRSRVIRAIGNAEERFEEDALRILRAMRFASVLGFTVEEKTREAIHKKAHLVKGLSGDRVRSEFQKMLIGKNILYICKEFPDVIGTFIPEMLPSVNFGQHTPFHRFDVWMHTAWAMNFSPQIPLIRTALFFHDLSKPSLISFDSSGRGHFFSHPKKSAEIARSVMARLGYPSKFIEDTATLIYYHDSHPTNGAMIKKLLSQVTPRLFWPLCSVMEADIHAHAGWTVKKRLKVLNGIKKEARMIISSGECYSLASLKLKGRDLAAEGFRGEAIGSALSYLLDRVIEGKIENDSRILLEAAKERERALSGNP